MLKQAYLEITNICNLNCVFCPGTVRAPRFVSAGDFRTMATRLQGKTEYLYFHLMGEPLLHPDLAQLFDIAQELGFRVILTTNGTLLPRRGEVLLRADALHKVNISLQSFEANRQGELEDYLAGCIAFAKECSAAGKRCELRLWNQGGLDTLNARIRMLLEGAFAPPWTDSRTGKKLAELVWLEPGESFDWPDLQAPDRGESCFCYGVRNQIGILCDGTVVPCCLDHNGDVPLGNLLQDDLESILSGPRARAIAEGFSHRRAVEPLCRSCGFARKF